MSEQARRFYISNKNESVPMFESKFMEFFSHVHPATPVILYVPVISYFLYRAFTAGNMSIFTIVALFVVGVFMWTLLEYVVHRYVFHYEPKTRPGKCCTSSFMACITIIPTTRAAWFCRRSSAFRWRCCFMRFFWNFGPFRAGRISRIWIWIRLLRHDPLRHTPFWYEVGRLALVEAIPFASPLSRRPCRLRRELSAMGLRFSD